MKCMPMSSLASSHVTKSCHSLEPETKCCGPFPVSDSQSSQHPETAGVTVFFPVHSSRRRCDCEALESLFYNYLAICL